LIEMNWGPADGIRFVFDTDDTLDQLKFAQTVKAAVEAGTRFSQRWVREQLGAPEPKDGEETIGGTPAADPNAPGGAGAPKRGANGPGEAKPNA
jgi:phage gp29-like protein